MHQVPPRSRLLVAFDRSGRGLRGVYVRVAIGLRSDQVRGESRTLHRSPPPAVHPPDGRVHLDGLFVKDLLLRVGEIAPRWASSHSRQIGDVPVEALFFRGDSGTEG